MNDDYIPCLKVYTNQTINYAKYIGQKRDKKPPDDTATSIPLSEQSVRRIRRVVDFMADTARWKKVWCEEKKEHVWFRLGFLTLTLPAPQLKPYGQIHCQLLQAGIINEAAETLADSDFKYTDENLKSFCLNHFLTVLREKYNVSKYLWKAESQKNGNIHFHILIDKFIHWKTLQYVWNRVLSKTSLIDEFEKKHGHRNPPTIEIHSVRKVKSIRKYITKYLSKSEVRKRKINGRRWACSEELSQYKGVEIELTGLKALDYEKLDVLGPQYIYYHDWFRVYKLRVGQLATVLEGSKIISEYVAKFAELYPKAYQEIQGYL